MLDTRIRAKGRRTAAARFSNAVSGYCARLLLNDRPADFISDRVDVGFRDGRMEDSEVVAKQLIPMQMIVCASPLYAKKHGVPRQVDDLAQHRCINFRNASDA